MSKQERISWQAVQNEVRQRISQRDWKPGDFIPHEADLAQEFGCARATVNRALRGLAEAGLLERRRRAGTRVTLNPVRRAEFAIPLIRAEIESKGQRYAHSVCLREMRLPPPDVQARMQVPADVAQLFVQTLYLANGAPYVFESRWINVTAIPAVRDEDFATFSPNEWLVREVAFDGGDFTFSAISASLDEAAMLSCRAGAGLFVLDRTTRHAGQVITSVRLVFHPGYQMHTRI